MALTLHKHMQLPAGVSPLVMVSGSVNNVSKQLVIGEFQVTSSTGGTIEAGELGLLSIDSFATRDAGSRDSGGFTTSNTNGTYGFVAVGTPATA